MTSSRISLVTIPVLAAMAATPALAVATVYTSPAAFLAQVAPGRYTETFEGSAGDAPSVSYASGDFGYSVSAPLQAGSAIYLSGTFISTLFANSSLTITFTSGAPTAVGANFYNTDASDAFVPSAAVTINLSDGSSTTFAPASAADYRGFISTVPISSLVLSAAVAGRFNTVDNLTVGLALPVPEPASALLLALGAVAVGGVALRRRRAG